MHIGKDFLTDEENANKENLTSAPSCGLPRGRTVLNWFGWQCLAQKMITLGIAEGLLQKPTQIPGDFRGHWKRFLVLMAVPFSVKQE